jgi:hypothetical protein
VRLDSANRSFFALVATALVPYVLLGGFGCGVLSVAVWRLATDGLGGLDRNGEDLRPAVAFFALVTTGTVVGALSVLRQVRATRALESLLAGRTVPLPQPVQEAAERTRLVGRVELVEDPEVFSFTYGLLSPRVVVSSGMVDALDAAQLEAVFHHERYHVRNGDTLKVVVARAAPAAFFFLPALGALRARYLAGRELAADHRAVRAVGRRALAGALHHALDRPSWSDFGAAAALGGTEFLDLRVTQLETGREPPLPRMPRWALVITAAGLAGLSIASLVTALDASDPTSMGPTGAPGGPVVGVLGGVLCMSLCTSGWVAGGLLLLRRGMGHRTLTLPARRTTSRS